ncbi:MAG: hypothetical protein JW850_02295 [Thermoflexales bacterium]|nr:hypothetical protein [Thermoflexales bacterium]
MIQRITALAWYFFSSLLFSLAGVLYILLALAFWWVFFSPADQTPHADYYILLLSVLGGGLAFLVTSSVAARANQAIHYPFLARLPRRVEYLLSILASALSFTTLLQLVVAALATFRGPSFTPAHLILMPLAWLPLNGLAAMLALHASDLVSDGWSRVAIYGALLACALGQKLDHPILSRVFGLPFWPFQALAGAVRTASLTPSHALATLLIVMYAGAAFILAVRLFSAKDLLLAEQ